MSDATSTVDPNTDTFADPPAAGQWMDAGDNVWEFEGEKFVNFVANQTGVITIPIKHPNDPTKIVAYIGAEFMWEGQTPFLDHLTLDTRDERNVRDSETERKRANITQKNAKLFNELVQSGFIIKINDVGEKSEPVRKTRDEMLKYQPEVQSELIDAWLGEFHVQRYFPGGVGDIDALLTDPESVFFKCSIGDHKNPASVIVMEFGVPSPDARRSYETDTFAAVSKTEGEKAITGYYINNQAKVKFAKKYFRNAQGAVIGPTGQFDIDTESLKPLVPTDTESVKEFQRNFCPTWWVGLADQLASCFDLAGK